MNFDLISLTFEALTFYWYACGSRGSNSKEGRCDKTNRLLTCFTTVSPHIIDQIIITPSIAHVCLP